jgi:uncharacterized protein (TIGR03437 family)
LAVFLISFAGVSWSQAPSFQPGTAYPGQQGPVSTAAADFNRDGKPDLAVANAGSSAVSIFLGKGDGTFAAGATVPIPGKCVAASLTAGDFNHDGNTDLLVICNFQTAFWVLPGQGNGQFGPPIVESPLPLPALVGYASSNGVAVADFNRDGNLDLVVTTVLDTVGAPLYLLLGNADGTFQTPVSLSNALTVSVVAADFDGDGNPDLALGVVLPIGFNVFYSLQILRGNGNGAFLETASYTPPGAVSSMTVADVNGDGKPDLIMATEGSSPQLTVYTGNGDCTFNALASVAENNPVLSLTVADLGDTGTPDLIEEQAASTVGGIVNEQVANLNFDAINLFVRVGNGDGTFQSAVPISLPTGLSPFSFNMAVGDWNGDGLPDLAFTASPSSTLIGEIADSNAQEGVAAYQALPTGDLVVMLNKPPATPLISLGTRRLQFSSVAGGANPTSQAVTVSNAGGGALNWTATSPAPWLTVTPPSGNGSASLTIVAVPGTMAAGAYTAIISVAATGATNSPQALSVSLVVAPPGDTPVITSVVNGASLFPGIESGSWVTITGSNLATTNPGRAWLASEIVNGGLPTSLDGTSVTIDGTAAYVSYISPTQINVQAPADSSTGPVPVVVTKNGQVSAAFTAQLQPYAPAFFLYPGTNYAVITRYPDNAPIGNPAVIPGTVAAQPDDILILWGTGFGATSPPTPPGVVVTDAATTALVTGISIDDSSSYIHPIGVAMTPGSAGLYQVAIQIPTSVPSGVASIFAVVAGEGGTSLQISPLGIFTYISSQ